MCMLIPVISQILLMMVNLLSIVIQEFVVVLVTVYVVRYFCTIAKYLPIVFSYSVGDMQI